MDAKMQWFRVTCTCVAGGGLWLTEGQMLRAEELGDHLQPLLASGAIVPVRSRALSQKVTPPVEPKSKTFSLR